MGKPTQDAEPSTAPPDDTSPDDTTPTGDTPSRLLTRTELAAAFNVTPLRITKWTSDGLPVKIRGSRGVEHKYSLPDVVQWRIRSEITRLGLNAGAAVNLETERARLARAQTEKAELDLQARRSQLLPADDVERVWLNITGAVREKLLAIPRASAARVAQEAAVGGAAAVEAALREEVHEALRELAAWTATSAAEAGA